MQFFGKTNIDFIGKRKYAFIFSGTLILVGIISLILQGGPKYGIDFTGGTSIQLKFTQDITVGDVRSALGKIGLGNAEVKRLGEAKDNEILIRVQEQSRGGQLVQDLIKEELAKDFGGNPYTIQKVDTVGPKIGGELRRAALMAIFVSLLGILIYVSLRFKFNFAVGAIIALVHDVLITLGIFSILKMEFSLTVLAAFLTIVGYSLNDTIVVFDRIRENLKVMRREPIDQIINTSINQTISRTVLTSLTTLIVVWVLLFFGGEVIYSFAFALMVGITIGTYSSIYVASPVVIEWERRAELKKGRSQLMRS